MKALFLFAPHWYQFEAPLGLPYICGFLKNQGIEVQQRDLNIESQNYFLSSHYMKVSLEHLSSNYGLDNLPWDLIDTIEKSKAAVKDKNVKVEDYIKAIKNLQNGFMVISKRFSPTEISFDNFKMRYSSSDSMMVREAITNSKENPYIEFYEKKVINEIDEDVVFIGISIIGEDQIIPGLTLANLIKRHRPNIHIAIGGTAFTILKDNYVSWSHLFDYFDSVVLYEGELTLLKLIRAIIDKKDISRIENLIIRDSDNNVVATNICNDVEQIELAAPDFDGLPLDDYFTPGRIIPYALNRSKCYWSRCTFCVHDISISNRFKALSMDRIKSEIIMLKEKYKSDTFDLLIENGLTPEFLESFSDMLINENLNIKWRSHFRIADKVNFKRLRQSGCMALFCGIESGSDSVLKKMNKGTTVQLNKRIIKEIADADIWVRTSFIYGFPGETIEDALETYKFIIDNKQNIHSLGGGKFILSRNSEVWKRPEDFNVVMGSGKDKDLALSCDYSSKDQIEIEKFIFQLNHALKKNYADYTVWSNIAGTVLFKILTRYNSISEAKQDFIRAARALDLK